jgi:hypothetical protein
MNTLSTKLNDVSGQLAFLSVPRPPNRTPSRTPPSRNETKNISPSNFRDSISLLSENESLGNDLQLAQSEHGDDVDSHQSIYSENSVPILYDEMNDQLNDGFVELSSEGTDLASSTFGSVNSRDSVNSRA